MSHFNKKIVSINCEFLFALPLHLRLSSPPLFWSLPAFRLPCGHVLDSFCSESVALFVFFSFPLLWLSICPALSYFSLLLLNLSVWWSPFPTFFLVIAVMKFYSLASTLTPLLNLNFHKLSLM